MRFILLVISLGFSYTAKSEINFINVESLNCDRYPNLANFKLNKNLIVDNKPETLLVNKVKPVKPQPRADFSDKDIIINFGAVYAVQWAAYLIDQYSIIKEMGSYENWNNNPRKPHFDKDNFEYNIFKHSLAGSYYYLWYRSRGYSLERSFLMSFMSSLAFEFTIETITERPSWQDIYQTPVFGTVLGLGLEKASRYFHSLDTWLAHALGYILNPFTLIPTMKGTELIVSPFIDKKEQGLNVSLRF